MKPFLFIASLCSLTLSVFSQQRISINAQNSNPSEKKAIDKASLRCVYLFSKRKPDANQPYRSDQMVLEIGERFSKFYDPARQQRDSLLNDRMKNTDPSTIKSINVFRAESAKDLSNMPGTVGSGSMEGESYQIVKDKQTSKQTILDYVSVIADRFKYTDEPGKLDWKISGETDTVLSYTCQKASLHFRGRDYIAWFSTDIPVSDGPWKFNGLPGLILKIEDTEGLFAFKLVGLEQLSTPSPILMDDSRAIVCTRQEFEKQKKKQGAGMQINLTAGVMTIAEMPGKVDLLPMEKE
ncbi:GLPGLI family protein [Pedobacter nutrimenti]|uniref:GLPGLI family protein n=1 Tax=Pedobacter nutrimenti TaxID=1241337 RepID=UPI002930CAC5|nr:GLPGLI family protein [Pedobacter nutrimenti]